MKVIIVLAALVAVALSAPAGDVETLKYDFDNIGVDGYNFAVETSDGTSRQETGVLNNAGTENESLSVKGSFSFVGDDGQTYTVDFIADENGYQPTGAHLPVAPAA